MRMLTKRNPNLWKQPYGSTVLVMNGCWPKADSNCGIHSNFYTLQVFWIFLESQVAQKNGPLHYMVEPLTETKYLNCGTVSA